MVRLERMGASLLLVILLIAPALAQEDSITLISPENGAVLPDEVLSQAYEFQLQNSETFSVCYLFLDDIKTKQLTYVLQNNTNMISLDTPVGNYYWNIKCQYETGGFIESETFTFTKSDSPISQEDPETAFVVSAPENKTNLEYLWERLPVVGEIPLRDFILGLIILLAINWYFFKK